MNWAVIIAAVVIVAVALCFFIRRQRRRSGIEIYIDPRAEANFYPEIEKCHEINIKAITCSCPDFREGREQFRHDDPRRLCKHLVRSFIDANSLPEELVLYKEGIERSDEDHSGFPTNRLKFDKLIGDKKISIMIPKEVTENDSRIDVYCEAKQYSYSPELESWANETAPPCEGEIIRFLHEKIGKPIPEERLDSIKTLPRIPAEKSKNEYGAADGGPEEFYEVESLLRTLLPPDGALTLKETKSYVAVTFNNSRKWICRLYLNARKSKYIEFPDGRRYEFNAVEDIAKYKEELMNAYSKNGPKKGKARMLFPRNETAPSTYSVTSMESRDNAPYFSRN